MLIDDNREAKFIYDAWKNPKTLALISKIAGVELVPIIDYEIGHINISRPGNKQEHNEKELIAEDDNKAVVDWHRDSYPFVCVLMMSDTTGMQGGETALRTGTGEIMKVRGPEMVRFYSYMTQTVFLTNSRDVQLCCKAVTSNIKLFVHSEDRNVSQW